MRSSRLNRLRILSIIAVLAAVSGVAQAKAQPWPLTTLPADKLLTLVPSLRDQDMALIEVDPRGALKQITTMTLVAAPPATVRDVVGHPERYGQFVHNMSRSDVKQEPGGIALSRVQARLHGGQRRRAASLRVPAGGRRAGGGADRRLRSRRQRHAPLSLGVLRGAGRRDVARRCMAIRRSRRTGCTAS